MRCMSRGHKLLLGGVAILILGIGIIAGTLGNTKKTQVQKYWARLPFMGGSEAPSLDTTGPTAPSPDTVKLPPQDPAGGVMPTPINALQTVRSWVSYYGDDSIEALRQFDLIDIDAESGAGNYTAKEIDALKANGKIVVSYLNIGAIETFRSYWRPGQVYKLDSYGGWPDEYWTDASQPGWQDLIISEAGKLLTQGVDGFYLDNLDVADKYGDRPELRRGVVTILERLRKTYPKAIMIAQNGLFLQNDQGGDGKRVYEYVDGWAQEEVFTTYEGGYRKVAQEQTDAYVAALKELQGKGLTTFCLDYADSVPLRNYARAEALKIGCRSYVGTKELDIVVQH